MIAQYLYECDSKIECCTCEIKGTKEQEEYAKFLWRVTKDLSDACFRDYGKKNIEEILRDEFLYDDEEIKKTLEAYPDLVSEDVITAYEQCLSKLRDLGMEARWINIDCDNPDVWTSTGVY